MEVVREDVTIGEGKDYELDGSDHPVQVRKGRSRERLLGGGVRGQGGPGVDVDPVVEAPGDREDEAALLLPDELASEDADPFMVLVQPLVGAARNLSVALTPRRDQTARAQQGLDFLGHRRDFRSIARPDRARGAKRLRPNDPWKQKCSESEEGSPPERHRFPPGSGTAV